MENFIFCAVIASKSVKLFFFHKAYWSENYTKCINAIKTSGVELCQTFRVERFAKIVSC